MKVGARLCFALLLLLATQPLFARAAALTLHTASSEPFTAYVAGPQNAHTGVVLVHDWFGISPFYTQAAEKLAERGYRVLAVDLYGGHSATTHDQAGKLLQSVQDDVAAREIDAAIGQLATATRLRRLPLHSPKQPTWRVWAQRCTSIPALTTPSRNRCSMHVEPRTRSLQKWRGG